VEKLEMMKDGEPICLKSMLGVHKDMKATRNFRVFSAVLICGLQL
jgi:hypothetical protein